MKAHLFVFTDFQLLYTYIERQELVTGLLTIKRKANPNKPKTREGGQAAYRAVTRSLNDRNPVGFN